MGNGSRYMHTHYAIAFIATVLLFTSTCTGTRQRPFDLYLIFRAWPHTPQAFLETVIAGMDTPKYGETLRDT